MTTRLYLTNSTAPYSPATAFRGTYNRTTGAVTKYLGPTPGGSAATIAGSKSSSSPSTYTTMFGRWVSDGALQAGTLSGTVSWCAGVVESNASANCTWHVHIFVTAGDSDTVRGTVLSNHVGSNEFPTTAGGYSDLDQTLTSLAIQAGDRLVVEMGVQFSTTSTSFTSALNYGNTGSVDLGTFGGGTSSPDTNVTSFPGWVQFSDPNNLFSATLSTSAKNLCPNPSCGSSSAAGWYNAGSATVSGSATTGLTGFSRTTGLKFTVTSTAEALLGPPSYHASAGDSWAVYLEANCVPTRTLTVYMDFRDAAGAFLTAPASQNVSVGSTPVQVVFSPSTAPTNTATVDISIDNNFTSGDVCTIAAVRYDLISSGTLTYADGDSAGWVWDGTAEVSTSHLSSAPVSITGDTPSGACCGGPDGAGVGVAPPVDTPSATRCGGPGGALVLADVYTDTPAGIRRSGPTGALQINLTVTDSPAGVRYGGPDGAQGSGLTFGPDTPSGFRYGGPDGSTEVDLTVTDSPRGDRYGGPGGTSRVGLTFGPDTPSATRGAGLDGSVFADVGGGVTLTDTPSASRYYGPDGVPAIGLTFGPDTPAANRQGGPDGALAIGVTFGPDTPSASRLGGPDGVAVVLVGATDTPSGCRYYGPDGLLAIAVPITGTPPSGLRYGGPIGAIDIGLGADLIITGTTPSALRGAGPDGQVLLAFLPTRPPYIAPTPVLVPDYALWVADTVTGRMLYELPMASCSWSQTLGDIGTLRATLAVDQVYDGLSAQDERDPRLLLRELLSGPWRFCLVLMWGNNPVWAGPYISLSRTGPATVDVNAAEIAKIFSKRITVNPAATYATDTAANLVVGPAASKGHIAAALLQQALAGTGRALPITVNDPGGTGVEYRTYFGYDLTDYWTNLSNLMQEDDGPEVRFDATVNAGADAMYLSWHAQIGAPYVGRGTQPWVFDSDINSIIGFDVDASNQAFGAWSSGTGDGPDKLIGHSTDLTSVNSFGYPMLEIADTSHSSEVLYQIVADYAAAYLAAYEQPVATFNVQVRTDADPTVGNYRVGEDFIVDIRDDPIVPDGTYRRRIAAISGTEKSWVTITDATSATVAPQLEQAINKLVPLVDPQTLTIVESS